MHNKMTQQLSWLLENYAACLKPVQITKIKNYKNNTTETKQLRHCLHIAYCADKWASS